MSSKSEETRRAILEATLELLEESGPHATRLADVAARAGVSRQAIYLHFKNRGGLLVALGEYLDIENGLVDRIAEVEAIADPVDRLLAGVSLSARYEAEIHDVAMAVDAVRHGDPDLDGLWKDRMANRRRAYRRGFEAVAGAGELHPDWTVDRAVDVALVLCQPQTYELLVVERGWSIDDYEQWVLASVRLLLAS